MVNFDFTIKDELGLHARPTGQLVKEAQVLTSKITIYKGDKSADLRRMFGVMSLAVKQNETIKVVVEGSDEEKDALYIENFLKEHF
jgi:phosphocarrier protein